MIQVADAALEFTKIQELVYELKIADVMTTEVITIAPDASLREAKEIMRTRRISGLPVVRGRELVGVISIEDIIKALESGEMDVSVGAKMTPNVTTLFADESVVQAVNMFSRYNFGRFPVVERTGGLAGIITAGDITRGLLKAIELDYRQEEISKYRASHIFEDIPSDHTSLVLRYEIKARDFARGGEASSRIKKALTRLGVTPKLVRRVAIATYEAEINIIIHSTVGGYMVVDIWPERIRLRAIDTGPGIPDVEQALQPGFSTAPAWIRELGFGAGMGLVNIKHCADEMRLQSEMDRGTNLEAVFHLLPARE
ncbi:MAG: CBS domain-containing protein [Chloroflexi bacterium]|nr:CBS domain-containing protein [Chloroflexota bacterium]MBU1747625.1 CBS domain-containing protein [Chloroflexota bacterium]MBU1879697.1 CBS domain-containing protein [Chloroflexota bacterium]